MRSLVSAMRAGLTHERSEKEGLRISPRYSRASNDEKPQAVREADLMFAKLYCSTVKVYSWPLSVVTFTAVTGCCTFTRRTRFTISPVKLLRSSAL